MIDTRLIGPKDDQYAVLSLGTVWLATTKKPYAEAVSAAIAATIAGGGATDAAPPATAATVDHGYDRTASLAEGHYVCLCGGACSRPDASQPSPTTKEQSK